MFKIPVDPSHLTLVQLGHGPQQVERPDVPHLGVGDDFESYDWLIVRMKAYDWSIHTPLRLWLSLSKL